MLYKYFVSWIIVGISYDICIFLYKLNWNIDKIQDQNGQTILSSSISLGITIITLVMDFIVEIVLEKLAKREKHYIWTNFYINYRMELTVFTFLNSALVPFFLPMDYR